MNPDDAKRMREMVEAIAPMIVGFVGLLLFALVFWRLHELRLRRFRQSVTASEPPSFYLAMVSILWPAGVMFFCLRPFVRGGGYYERLPQRLQAIATMSVFLAGVVYPAVVLVYVAVAQRFGWWADGPKFQALCASTWLASITLGVFVTRPFAPA